MLRLAIIAHALQMMNVIESIEVNDLIRNNKNKSNQQI